MLRYEVEHVYQSENVKLKSKQTCLQKYGVEHHNQCEEGKLKRKETNMLRYGGPAPMSSEYIKSKASNTYFEKTGYTHNFKNPKVHQKRKETWLKIYGVEHPIQNEEIFNKQQNSLFKNKEYIFSSGRIEYVQGYEPQVLDELVNHFDEDDIVCSKGLPKIWYEFEGKRHRYFPDIYIKSRNMIIEVKSTYTLKANMKMNLAKRQACIDAGYNFWFIIGK